MPHRPSYTHFLKILMRKGSPAAPSLFEPLIHIRLAEQLIWRRGVHVWDTPTHILEAMISLQERIGADVVTVDARIFQTQLELRDLLTAADIMMHEEQRIVLLCDRADMQAMAEQSDHVCAIAGYGQTKPLGLPFIRMDGCIEDAVRENAAGYFAAEQAGPLWQRWHDRVAICGGLDARWVEEASPIEIHRRITALTAETKNCGYLVGTGGTVCEDAYLSLISMLGIMQQLRSAWR